MTRKAPEQTREKLLQAATHVVLTQGRAHLTLDRVAAEAGISKGGLLHHFPTKESLLIGLMKHAFAIFDNRLQRHMAADISPRPGRWLRAYIRATFESAPEEDELTKALIILATSSPGLVDAKQAELQALFAHMELDGMAPARAWAVRLACDGLWIGELYGELPLDQPARAELEQELLRLAQGVEE
jgi:AcrR family transcriptional regulator